MASVWSARDQTRAPRRGQALYARDERDKQRLVQQFLREARIAASVHHRNVISIVEFGSTDGQQPFMVMELLEGETPRRAAASRSLAALGEACKSGAHPARVTAS